MTHSSYYVSTRQEIHVINIISRHTPHYMPNGLPVG
jgi:hypothetical protein